MAKKENRFNTEMLDELIKDYKNADDIVGSSGVVKQLTKALLERVPEGEMCNHLGYEKPTSRS